MVLPNDAHAGSGGTSFPTHLVGGKEYPVGMTSGPDGHIHGSLPAYGLVIPPSAVGAGKVFFDLFNAQAGVVLRIRKLFAIVATDVAVTGALGVRLDTMRTSAVGTGGTPATVTKGNASKTAASFYSFDPNSSPIGTLAAGVTARAVPTGGGTDEANLWPSYVFTEETNMSSHFPQFFNLLPEMPFGQTIELPQNYGLKVVQGSVASVGTIAFLVNFTVE